MSARDLLAPIPGDNPSGVELRYEPIYDEIKEARRDETDLPPELYGEGHAPKKADWPRVIKLSEAALSEKTKDLQIAAWLAEAQLHRDGYGGLAEGLRLVRSLVTDFWDGVFPEIDGDDAEFRAAPLNWIGTTLDISVQRVPVNEAGHDYLAYKESLDTPTQEEANSDSDKATRRAESDLTPEDAEAGFQGTSKTWFKGLVAGLQDALTELEELDAACQERFSAFERTDQIPPTFSATQKALELVYNAAKKLLTKKLELDPDPVGTTDVSDTGETTVTPAEATAGPPTTREDACARMAVAARFMRQESPTDPGPYLMVRGLRWGELRAGGSTVDPRLLAAPPTATRTRLKGLLLDGAWSQLLEAAEETMATPFGRGWLDLQRYILTATDALGGDYEPVGKAIRGALQALLQDLPDLSESTLMDDTPTANRETRAWLKDEGLFGDFSDSAEAELAGRASSTPATKDAEGVARVMRRARSEAQAGRHERAIKMLQKRAAVEGTNRGRFLLRTEAAAVMVEAGHNSVALPILRELYNETSAAQPLSDWEEPSVVARPIALLYRCALRNGDGSVDTNALYLEVCRLDPMMAIDLQDAAPAAEEPNEEAADG